MFVNAKDVYILYFINLLDGGPSNTTYIGPLTCAMIRRIEKEKNSQKTSHVLN